MTIQVSKCNTRFSSIKIFRDDMIRGKCNRHKSIENDRLSIYRSSFQCDSFRCDSFQYNYRAPEHIRYILIFYQNISIMLGNALIDRYILIKYQNISIETDILIQHGNQGSQN